MRTRRKCICYPLFALVFISPLQIIYRHKLFKGLSHGIGPEDVQAEVENAVEGVAIVTAALTCYS